MKINSKYISIPPYISTKWENVSSIQMDGANTLIISLMNGSVVTISNLPAKTIEDTFNAHQEHLELSQAAPPMGMPLGLPSNAGGLMDGMGNMTGMMQHDPSQADSPNLPAEMLSKVSAMAKALGLDNEAFALPEAEKDCNCQFCQITRAMHGEDQPGPDSTAAEKEEEIVQESELQFREWNIDEVGDKLYKVTNPFDSNEVYQVYLGNPVGCTCGKTNCEHIITVLNN